MLFTWVNVCAFSSPGWSFLHHIPGPSNLTCDVGVVNFRGFESANLSHNSVHCTVTVDTMAGFKLTMVLETFESVGGV